MTYVVQSTEKIRGSGADYETKAMLYLMNCRDDSYEIYSFVIDFFNDVTGLNNFADKAWDLQSKGAKNNSPRAIGKELVTLLKNYMSDLKFDFLILFLGGVTSTFRKNSSINTFGIDNVKDTALKSLKEGLIEEGKAKTYIYDEWLTDENIDSFLKQVTFVVDDKSKADYIRNLIAVNPKFVPKDDILESIFNTIRDKQASKKNNESVEGVVISNLSDAYFYDRSLKAKEIRLMVLNSFINRDIMNHGIPIYFAPVIKRYDALKQKDIVEDCALQLSTLLFDKSNTEGFWNLMSTIADTVAEHLDLSTTDIYVLVKDNPQIRNPRLDTMSIQYLISIVKEALI